MIRILPKIKFVFFLSVFIVSFTIKSSPAESEEDRQPVEGPVDKLEREAWEEWDALRGWLRRNYESNSYVIGQKKEAYGDKLERHNGDRIQPLSEEEINLQMELFGWVWLEAYTFHLTHEVTKEEFSQIFALVPH
jgi:hypothetical protein